ncbi:MAG: Trx7/PDZ domain-containing (seleno)protein [Planctomycetota bacterium]|nr:thioredoxin family protein [Gemmataceae bacterium]
MNKLMAGSFICVLVFCSLSFAQTREQKVKDDKTKNEASGFWHYNNFTKGVEDAKTNKKPMMVVLRCLPCEECVKLDDELMEKDTVIKSLLEKFVRVRIVGTNGLDLSLFQFDYDQSFAIMFLNADGSIYGRYGTRSHRTNWSGDVSLVGLGKAMQEVLQLHENYPKNKPSLVNKKGPKPDFASPELFPSLKTKYTSKLDYEGKVVQSCIHCHQVGEAIRENLRLGKSKISEEVLFPHPHPKSIGLVFHPDTLGTLIEVKDKSFGGNSGFKKGDVVRMMNGQAIISIADVQWVLNLIPASGGKIPVEVLRNNQNVNLELCLPEAWRRLDDISWRSSSWMLRRMVLGGILLESMSAEEMKAEGLKEDAMALRVKHVGQFGPHATAHKAGVLKGDILLGFDEKTNLLRESDIFFYAIDSRKAGDMVSLTLKRNKNILQIKIPIQE